MSAHLDTRSARSAALPSGLAPYSVEYVSARGGRLPKPDGNTLAVIGFHDVDTGDDPRVIRVPLVQLGDQEIAEVWRSAELIEHGWVGGIGYARNSEVILMHLKIDEARFPNMVEASHDAYSRVQEFLQVQGYPHPIRIWNHFPDINAGSGDQERYKQFALGRGRVIESLPEYEERLPAASAIGSSEPGFSIYLLAARQGGVQIENPRQVSAFRYPRQYGPRSPSFSRARLVRWPRERHLYLSGTASVVGHETLHVDDAAAQIQETFRNIESLLSNTAVARPALPGLGWADLRLLRVYVRDAADLPAVRRAIEEHLGPDTPVQYLRGDICRRDLAVEIEGIFTATT